MAAKRMVLIPAEMHQQQGGGLNNLIIPSVPLQPPPPPQWEYMVDKQQNPANALDSAMSTILQDKNLSADAKYAQYQYAIHRHRMLHPQTQAYKRARTVHDTIEMNVEQLLRSIPDRKKRSARMLINFLATLRQFSVNGQNEIQLNGETIEGTNLIELLREFSMERKNNVQPPKGYHQFMNLLLSSGVPLEAIGNERYRQQLTSNLEGEEEEDSIIHHSHHSDPLIPSHSFSRSVRSPLSSVQIPSRVSSGVTIRSLQSKRKKDNGKKTTVTHERQRRRRRSSSSDDNIDNVGIRGVMLKEEKTWKDYKQSTTGSSSSTK